jgi:hypothetical protein
MRSLIESLHIANKKQKQKKVLEQHKWKNKKQECFVKEESPTM